MQNNVPRKLKQVQTKNGMFNYSRDHIRLVQRHSPTYQAYYALDKSTKIGTHVDYHLINVLEYGGAHQCTHSDHGNNFQNGCHEISLFLIKITINPKILPQQ